MYKEKGICMTEKDKIMTEDFEKDQINEIKLGALAGIDTSVYADKK